MLLVLAAGAGWALLHNDPLTPQGIPGGTGLTSTYEQSGTTVSSTTPTPTVAAPATTLTLPHADATDPAADAVRVWFTLVCPHPVYPEEARALMTADAWAALDQRPPVVPSTWTCGPVTVQPPIPTMVGDTLTVAFTAERRITPGDAAAPFTETVLGARLVTMQEDGTWLVGVAVGE